MKEPKKIPVNVKIVCTSEKGVIEIPLTTEEVRALGDLAFWFEEIDWKNFKLNKIDKPVASLTQKWAFLLFDVVDDGRSYKCDAKLDKFVFSGNHYIVKKPKWRRAR